jgi:hypothetical protein
MLKMIPKTSLIPLHCNVVLTSDVSDKVLDNNYSVVNTIHLRYCLFNNINSCPQLCFRETSLSSPLLPPFWRGITNPINVFVDIKIVRSFGFHLRNSSEWSLQLMEWWDLAWLKDDWDFALKRNLPNIHDYILDGATARSIYLKCHHNRNCSWAITSPIFPLTILSERLQNIRRPCAYVYIARNHF